MIEEFQVIDLPVRMDDRGYLFEIVRAAGGEELHAVAHQFGQVYLVGDPVRGTVRAYHKHDELWDWFCIVHGTAKFVLRDDRRESPTYREIMEIVIGDKRPRLIVVPPGVYHGWMSLTDDVLMVSVASHTYNRESPDEHRIPPDSFGDVWTVKGR
jgi:dTDP-4-dehydrorhamnose 3,5-epimerase